MPRCPTTTPATANIPNHIENPGCHEAMQTAKTAGSKLCGIASGREFLSQKRTVFILNIQKNDAKISKLQKTRVYLMRLPQCFDAETDKIIRFSDYLQTKKRFYFAVFSTCTIFVVF
jgi:hypothetical protein